MNRDDAVEHEHTLTARRLGIDTKQEPVIYMREDCAICRSEGFNAHSRVRVIGPKAELVATLNVVKGDLLDHGQAGFSEAAWWGLQLRDREPIRIHQGLDLLSPLPTSAGSSTAVAWRPLTSTRSFQILSPDATPMCRSAPLWPRQAGKPLTTMRRWR